MPRPIRPRENKQRRKSQGNRRDYDGQNVERSRVKEDQQVSDQARRWAFQYA